MKLVEIPISRFRAEVPLSRDTYLFLSLNNKAIRIALAGGVIGESMLAKILAKGHSHLRIAEESQIDPAIFSVHLDGPQPPTEPLVSIQASEEKSENILSFAGEAQVNPKSDFAPEAALSEGSTSIAPTPTLPDSAQAFSADADQETISRVSATPTSAEEETRLAMQGDEDDPESRFGAAIAEDEAKQRISTKEEPSEKYVRKFAPEKEPLAAVIRLQKKMAEAGSSEVSIDLRSEKELALKEARTVILSSKISEKIISLSEQARHAEPSLRDSLRGQVRNLKGALDQVDSGDLSLEEKPEFEAKEEISEVVESLASASRAEQVEEVTERLSAHALTRELAMSAMEEQEGLPEKELARSATSRDLPTTVSRLAAYLGHSLGYTNVNFLADLGCGAIAHFARKEGEGLDEEALPPFSKRIISADETFDEAVTDSREILQFLEAYIDDHECDRSHKDLLKRVFDRTMQEFSEKEEGPSPLSLRKWSSFVDRGPTMDSHSICTRASAKAVKQARAAAK